jgi:hypothetical protein
MPDTSPHLSTELPGDLSHQARDLLRQVSVYGAPLENHCRRLAEFAIALGEKRGVAMPADFIVAAAYLHDIGLCVDVPDERNYLRRGLLYIWPYVQKWHLSNEEQRIVEDIMLYSHSVKSVSGISPEGELVRLAVRIEHSLGQLTQGLDRAFCRSVFAAYPRKGFNRVLLSFFRTTIVDDGAGELRRIFFPEKRSHLDGKSL